MFREDLHPRQEGLIRTFGDWLRIAKGEALCRLRDVRSYLWLGTSRSAFSRLQQDLRI